MSDGTRSAEALQKLAKHAPPEAFEQEYEKLLRNHPFRAELIGSENPYTGREIASETDYRGFLRECAYASLLDRAERQAENGRKADRQLERREKEAAQAAEEARMLQAEADKRSDAFRAERDKAVRARRETRIGLIGLAAALLIFAAIFLPRLERTAYQKGFTAAQTETEQVRADQTADPEAVYQSAYAAGFAAGKKESEDAARASAPTEPETEQAAPETVEETRPAEETGEEITYIGNLNSHIFHRSDCKNLPAEKNRITFDSREQAEEYGYTPCSNCNP